MGGKWQRNAKADRNERILMLRSIGGFLYEQIAENIGCSKDIVQRICQQNGLIYSRQEIEFMRNKSESDYLESCARDAENKVIQNISDGFEYIGGYTCRDGIVRLRCKKCGNEFIRSAQQALKSGIKECPHCKSEQVKENNRKRELQRFEIKEQRKAEKERRQLELEQSRIANTRKVVCIMCGKEFETKRNNAKCCSTECSKRYANRHQDKRIPKEHRNPQINAKALMKRDNGRCWICGGQCRLEDYTIVDGAFIACDWYPSVDHLNAICDGGTDTWDNVKLAHRICNSRRYWDEKACHRSQKW